MHRLPDPWRRSVEESVRRDDPDRRLTLGEGVVVAAVIAAVVVMAIWFVFVSHGGIGPGTV